MCRRAAPPLKLDGLRLTRRGNRLQPVSSCPSRRAMCPELPYLCSNTLSRRDARGSGCSRCWGFAACSLDSALFHRKGSKTARSYPDFSRTGQQQSAR